MPERGDRMKLTINWSEPVLPEEDIPQITPSDLNDFYVSASDLDKSNLFFVLLTSCHHHLDHGRDQTAAHLCWLMAYYLFVALTPPGSLELALHYIRRSIALDPREEYVQWRELIKKGN